MGDENFQFTEGMLPYCTGSVHYPKEISEFFSGLEWNEFTFTNSAFGWLIICPVKLERQVGFQPAIITKRQDWIPFNTNVGDFIASHVVNDVKSATLTTTSIGHIRSSRSSKFDKPFHVDLLDSKLSIIQTRSHFKIRIKTKIKIRYYKIDPGRGAVDIGELYPEEHLLFKLEFHRGTLEHFFGKSIYDSRANKALLIRSKADNLDVRNASLYRENRKFIGYSKSGHGVIIEESQNGHSMRISHILIQESSQEKRIAGTRQVPLQFYGFSLQSIIGKIGNSNKTRFTCHSDTSSLGERVIGIREFENDYYENNSPVMNIQKYAFYAFYDKFGLHIEWSADVNDLQKNTNGRWEPGIVAGDVCIPWEPLLLSEYVSVSNYNRFLRTKWPLNRPPLIPPSL
ncbi:MAG: hypothetical protein GY742_18755 [Hyphomicrobiales bacterium]|nr:hypothetical protein [Hyphomicrobiales bacterium]